MKVSRDGDKRKEEEVKKGHLNDKTKKLRIETTIRKGNLFNPDKNPSAAKKVGPKL